MRLSVPIIQLKLFRILTAIALTGWQCPALSASETDAYAFTAADIVFLKTFSLSSLPPPPLAPSNSYANNIRAAKLGKSLFFDLGLSKGEKFFCASCHQPQQYFTDGLARARAHGTARRSTPTLLGAAWSPWQYWDGRKDSLWSQALGPIEHPGEMALDRTSFAKILLQRYGDEYRGLFGNTPDLSAPQKQASPLGDAAAIENWESLSDRSRRQINRVFVNAGKALMAYQRQLRLPRARFDRFVDSLARTQGEKDARTELASILSQAEVEGMRLFMGKANCASCHNGPLFTNFEFHNIGAPEPDPERVDLGRYSGVQTLAADEFTCLSEWSDAGPTQCEEMRFLKRAGAELVGAFKTPTLRNVAATAPYMQAGQLDDLAAVLNHYNVPKPPLYDREQHPNRPHFDILPLKLDDTEMASIAAFLATLTSHYPEDDIWWNQ